MLSTENPSPEPSAAGSIVQFRAVTKRYYEGEGRERSVFCDLSVGFEPRRITILEGASGSGKSTLLNLIAGIDLPDEGDVYIDGVAINVLPDRERTLIRRRDIGIVFQSFNLIPTLNVLDNVSLPLELARCSRGVSTEKARRWLALVGLAERENSAPEALSGGEQQRVALARALVHEPKIILADEPTGNLDRNTGREVLALLKGLVKEQGRTLIMATHSEEAAQLGDIRYRVSASGLERVA